MDKRTQKGGAETKKPVSKEELQKKIGAEKVPIEATLLSDDQNLALRTLKSQFKALHQENVKVIQNINQAENFLKQRTLTLDKMMGERALVDINGKLTVKKETAPLKRSRMDMLMEEDNINVDELVRADEERQANMYDTPLQRVA